MILRHHLATKINDLPLGPARFYTVHESHQGEDATDVGFAILAAYAGKKDRQKKHKYELVFGVEEMEEILEAMLEVYERFGDPAKVQELLEKYDELSHETEA